MSDQQRRSPARLLAPLALVVFAIAFLMVIGAGLGGGDDGGSDDAAETTGRTTTEGGSEADRPRQRRERTTYTVKLNDTLGGIAEDTGVPVETLLELNPELDPQALVTGQKVKLRE